jgi:CHAT domain-containing protein
VLWDCWPHLGFKDNPNKELGDKLFFGSNDPYLKQCCSIVYDDITFFYDIAAHAELKPEAREATKIAYLSIRPLVFKKENNFNHRPPVATLEHEYIFRLVVISASIRKGLQPAVNEVLNRCASRYKTRNNNMGVVLCEQNIEIFKVIGNANETKEKSSLSSDLFNLAVQSGNQCVAFEILLQWSGLFDADFAQNLDLNKGALQKEDVEALDILLAKFKMLRPLADLVAKKTSAQSTLVALLFLQYGFGRRLEFPLEGHASIFTAGLPSTISLLRSSYAELRNFDMKFFESFVATLPFGHKISLDDPLDLYMQLEPSEILMQVAMDLSKNQITTEALPKRLDILKGRKLNPIVLEGLLYNAIELLDDNKALGVAMIDSLNYIKKFIDGRTLVEKIESIFEQTRTNNEIDFGAKGDECEKSHRYGKAITAFYNAAEGHLKKGDFPGAWRYLKKGWDLIIATAEGKVDGPSNSFEQTELVLVTLQYGQRLAEYMRDAKQALSALNTALSLKDKWMKPDTKGMYVSRIISLSINSHAMASQRLYSLGLVDEAEERMTAAKEMADKTFDYGQSAKIRVFLSFFSYQRKEWDMYLNLLQEAQKFANMLRRSFPYESDKVKACTDTQEAFVYALDKYVEFRKPWEAVQTIEGLRSRALLDILGLTQPISSTVSGEIRAEGENCLRDLRNIAFPGFNEDNWAFRNILSNRQNWIEKVSHLDQWLENNMSNAEHAAILRGESLSIAELQQWACDVTQPTCVIYWALGAQISYQIALVAIPGQPPTEPTVLKVPLTMDWLKTNTTAFKDRIQVGENPSLDLFKEISTALLGPVASYITQCEVVYLCPAQEMKYLPMCSLFLSEELPLNTVKKVSVIRSLSVLRVLKLMKHSHGDAPNFVSVFGPEFGLEAEKISRLTGTTPLNRLFREDDRKPFSQVTESSILHLICHGFFDQANNWSSGFIFNHPEFTTRLTGHDIITWNVKNDLVFLQACDTGKDDVSITEDSFGLGRFFYIAGASSLILNEWVVRFDVTRQFTSAFYRYLTSSPDRKVSYSEAYRHSLKHIYDTVGKESIFLWAPFSFEGAITN